MAQLNINIGTPNGNDGDTVRDAFSKTEDNFTELYNSQANLTAELIADTTVGGVTATDTFPIGTAQEDIIRAILSTPLILPTNTINSISLIVTPSLSTYLEVGSTITGTLSSSFTAGIIDSKDTHPNVNLTGGITGNANYGGPVTVNSVTGDISTTTTLGTITWSVSQAYDAIGTPGGYYDSKGNEATNLDNLRIAGSVNNSLVRTGIYPYFYGKGASHPSAGSTLLTTASSKQILPGSGDISVTFNTTGTEYTWIAIPSSYSNKITWYVNALDNGAIGTSSPSSDKYVRYENISVNSPDSLWNGILYDFYISENADIVDSITFKQ